MDKVYKYTPDSYKKIIRKFGQNPDVPIYIKQSSGDSFIVVYPKITAKIYKYNKKLHSEQKILETVKSDNLIKLLYEEDKYKIYETVTPLKNCPENVIKLLCNISCGLIDLHRNGFIHGDTGISNIGLNNDGNYVLFDLEDAKEDITPRSRFRDVEMFLEDLIIHCRKKDVILLNNLLKKLRDKHKYEEIDVMFLGKHRKRMQITYNYSVNDFGELINDLCKKIGL